METKNLKKIIIGLNNPGKEYDSTPHNVGKNFILWLLWKLIEDGKISDEIRWKNDKKLMAKTTEITLGNKDLVFVLPQTFMNNSGLTVSKIFSYYKADLKSLIVVHDEADMLMGKSKLGFNYSSAGHRGIESIISNLKTQAFWRYRIGVRPIDIIESKYRFKAGDFVVQKLSRENQRILESNFEKFYIDIVRWIMNT